MTISVVRIILVCLSNIFVGTTAVLCLAQAPNVTGVVRDSNNQEMRNVLITLWRNGKDIVSYKTGRGKTPGTYEIYAPPDKPIDAITFDPPDLIKYASTTLERLSGKDNQNVSVLIMRISEIRELLSNASNQLRHDEVILLCDQMDSLVTIWYLKRSNGMSQPEFMSSYTPLVESLTSGTIKDESSLYRKLIVAKQRELRTTLVGGGDAGAEKKAKIQLQPLPVEPTEEHMLLEKNVGTWDAIVKVWPTPGAEPMESKGIERNELLPGRFWLMSRFESETGNDPYSGIGMTGYDPNRKEFVETWYNSTGPLVTHSKSNYDAESKTFSGMTETQNPATGEVYAEKFRHGFNEDGTRLMEVFRTNKDDGKIWKILEIRYERRNERPRSP